MEGLKFPMTIIQNKLSHCAHYDSNRCDFIESKDFKERKKYLSQILNSIVDEKTSGSVIIYGTPGSGKSQMVESCLAELSESNMQVVRLNGLLCTDLISSIEEICYQLKFQFEKFEKKNIGAAIDDRIEGVVEFFRENLENADTAIVFILDHLELFTKHKKQALLYLLLDLTQSGGKVPIGIVGLTSAVDLLEHLEKRVKSRFSHRQINLRALSEKDYFTTACNLLTIDKPSSKDEKSWNENLTQLMGDKEIKRILTTLYDSGKTISHLSLFLYEVIINCQDNLLTKKNFTKVIEKRNVSCMVSQALSLPHKDLFVLAAIKKYMGSTHKAFRPDALWEIVAKTAKGQGFQKQDFIDSIANIQRLEFITAVDSSSRQNLEKFEILFKAEISDEELSEVFKSNSTPVYFKEII